MKAKINTKDLKTALEKLSTIPGGGNGLVGNFLVTIDADEFSGITVARTTITSAVRILSPGEALDSGKVALPYLSLLSAVSTCEGEELLMEDKHGELVIKSGEDDRTVKILKDSELIPSPPPLKGQPLVVEHDEFMESMSICAVAMPDDGTRANIYGMAIRAIKGGLQLFGTNGHRIHAAKLAALIGRIDPEPNSDRDYGILIPEDGVECLRKLFKEEKHAFHFIFSNEGIQVESGDISARLPISGERAPFVDAMLRPASSYRTKINREALLKAARAVKATSGDDSIRFFVSPVNIRVSASSSEATANRTVPCEGGGSGQYIMRAKYVVDCLTSAKGDSVTIDFADKQGFSIVEGEYDFLVLFQSLTSKPK